MRAMQQLLAIPASDPQAAEHWIEIRRYLNMALRDPCEKIAEMCLKLHSRTLASSHYKVSVEIYINLVEHLTEYFRDKELEKRAIKATGVEFTSVENNFILRIVSFLDYIHIYFKHCHSIFFKMYLNLKYDLSFVCSTTMPKILQLNGLATLIGKI
jgi:hypothetical protein